LNRFMTAFQLFMLATLSTLSGCGSGGGDVNAASAALQTVITLSAQVTQGAIASDAIKGIQLTLKLPEGVTVETDSNGKTVGGVVVASGKAAGSEIQVGNYVSSNGTITIVIAKSAGFGAGEYATITCGRASGVIPASSDFVISDFKAVECSVNDQQGVQNCGAEIQNVSSAQPTVINR
jgi:hypothetical protein